jgi:hypothetical protein
MFIGIIGSAGRGVDATKWTKQIYVNCFHHLDQVLLADTPVSERNLISGGAAFSDHLAVSLFLAGKAASLQIHAPCQFHIDNMDNWFWSLKSSIPGYVDDGTVDFNKNPGGTLNYYHRRFSDVMQANTMAGIAWAIEKGAIFSVHYPPEDYKASPLHYRNLQVGKNLDRLYAFTWGIDATTPKDGGTSHCWKNSNSKQKFHIPLDTMR